jgi:hypothetical protein
MFGLMVIQQRLRGVESRLGEMEGRLVDIEHSIAKLGARPEPASGVDEQGRNGSPSLDRLQDPVGRG